MRRVPQWLIEMDAHLEWMRFALTGLPHGLTEAEVAPGHTSSSPFVIRCVAAQVFGKAKGTKAQPNAQFMADPRGMLDKYFAICVAKEQKGEKSGKDYSAAALQRAGYKGRDRQYKAALAMAREQTAKRREAAGKAPYGPSKGKKKTRWGKRRSS